MANYEVIFKNCLEKYIFSKMKLNGCIVNPFYVVLMSMMLFNVSLIHI